jgi:hypothetical protein
MRSEIRTRLIISAGLAAAVGFGVALAVSRDNASSQSIPAPGSRADNFRLLDSAGVSHELYYMTDKKAVVLVAQGNSCEANVKSWPELKKLRDQYGKRNVEFLMINSNLTDSRDQVAATAKKQGIDLPILLDPTQLIGESLGLKHNGEVLVLNLKDWSLAYRGNAEGTGAALDAVLAGKPVKNTLTAVSGCAIDMPEAAQRSAHANISYSKTIAPMLIDNCVTCHRAGGIGPWQMSSYDMVKGFAPMIREVIRTERMPPWNADPHYGVFKNDRSLSAKEMKTLVHWIEAGAPRGQGNDPLAELKKSWPEWELGEPDAILEIPAFEVPATGVVPYQDVRVKNTIGRDVYLRAVDYLPDNRAVVHHVLGYALPADAGPLEVNGGANGTSQKPGEPSPESLHLMEACSTPEGAAKIRARIKLDDQSAASGRASIGGYVPGSGPEAFPPDAGTLIKKDSDFRFQVHYTPNGKASKVVTRVGLYYTDEKPKYAMRSATLLDACLKIPANTKDYTTSMSRVSERDMYIYRLGPHAHYRGVAASFVAEYPNGKRETLLSVPKYDFNWQMAYELATPKFIPKGTKITYFTTYDNSSLNKANPNPNQVVHWGEQSWEEMLYGYMNYREVDGPEKSAQASQ